MVSSGKESATDVLGQSQQYGDNAISVPEDESDPGSDVLDAAELERLRTQLRKISDWMEQMSSNSAKGQPKLFERLSRGILDRMPLSYGKRDSGFENKFGKEYGPELLRTAKESLTKVSAATVNKCDTENTGSIGTLKTFLDTLLPQRNFAKEVKDKTLNSDPENNRVPSDLIGKRNWESVFSSMPRQSRGRLERMPLTYGKRSSELFQVGCLKENSNTPLDFAIQSDTEGNIFIKCHPQSSFDSSYNKEDIFTTNADFLDTDDWMDKKSQKGTSVLDTWTPLVRVRRSRLERMPFAYRKRYAGMNPTHINPNSDPSFEREPSFQRFRPTGLEAGDITVRQRSRMNRMPLTYGKRSFSLLDLANKRGRLDRMPLNFGKRNNLSPHFQKEAH
ncbi:hypothetical protein Bpfe_030354 [Biomphalaria pfeifferi]|uniref:Uncharacterized protein n=1 Tax=Biomphalaria pfeifferi TaxID=112525 RepID=A0AAD8APT7_BIOPF|nr:hypothetical protein Bpfe_030354 [Biomphalaria pfeifferi]